MRLFVIDEPGTNAKIIHPLIAEALIRRLSNSKTNHDLPYQEAIYRAAIGIVDAIDAFGLGGDSQTRDIILDLFIRREFWSDKASRRNFSELINMLRS